MDFDDELDALINEVLVAKKQVTKPPKGSNKKSSEQAEQFAFGSDSEEEKRVDTSIVKQEPDDSAFEHTPLLEVEVKEEYDSVEDDGGSSEDEEKPSFELDEDGEIKQEDEWTDEEEVQPKTKRIKKTPKSQNERSGVEDQSEATDNEDTTAQNDGATDDEATDNEDTATQNDGDSTKKKKSKRLRKGRRLRQRQHMREREAAVQARISAAGSRREEELMSLVFGGTNEIASQLAKAEKVVNPFAKQKPGKKSLASAETEKAERSVVWHDSDDENDRDETPSVHDKKHGGDVERASDARRRKEFEQIVGKPKWADLDREREPSDSEDEMMRKVGHVVKGTASQSLPKSVIELKKLKDLTRDTEQQGEIASISFHPTSMVAIVTSRIGNQGMVSIVTVDGMRNEKLHTILLDKFRIYCSRLSPDGNEVVFGSYRKFYHIYNLISGESDTRKIPPRETWSLRNFRISPCGEYIASVGDSGEVHLLSAKGKELLRTIQLRYGARALAFSPDSRHLLCHSCDTEVTVYSLVHHRIVNVFHDDGCVNGSAIAVCPNGQFVATGSKQGVVNIYSLDVTLEQKLPVPLKTILNLTTAIDSLTFNATSELLAMSSCAIHNAVKLVHVKSGTVFKNFPITTSMLGKVSAVEFSPSGGFLAIGNRNGVVSLLRVKHYANY